MNLNTGEQVGPTISVPQTGTYTYGFSPDATRIITADGLGAVRIWDAQTGQQIGPLLQHDSSGQCDCAIFSPDGTRVLSIGGYRIARIWDVRPKQRINADIAEILTAYCAGERFDPETGSLKIVSQNEREQLLKKLSSSFPESADWRFVIAQNLPQDLKTALISPRMTPTVRDIASKLIASNRIFLASSIDATHPLLPFTHRTVAWYYIDHFKQQDTGAINLVPADVSAANLKLLAKMVVHKGVCDQKIMALALLNRAREKMPEDAETKEFRAQLENPNYRFSEEY